MAVGWHFLSAECIVKEEDVSHPPKTLDFSRTSDEDTLGEDDLRLISNGCVAVFHCPDKPIVHLKKILLERREINFRLPPKWTWLHEVFPGSLELVEKGFAYRLVKQMWEESQSVQSDSANIQGRMVSWQRSKIPWHVELRYRLNSLGGIEYWQVPIKDVSLADMSATARDFQNKVLDKARERANDLLAATRSLAITHTRKPGMTKEGWMRETRAEAEDILDATRAKRHITGMQCLLERGVDSTSLAEITYPLAVYLGEHISQLNYSSEIFPTADKLVPRCIWLPEDVGQVPENSRVDKLTVDSDTVFDMNAGIHNSPQVVKKQKKKRKSSNQRRAAARQKKAEEMKRTEEDEPASQNSMKARENLSISYAIATEESQKDIYGHIVESLIKDREKRPVSRSPESAKVAEESGNTYHSGPSLLILSHEERILSSSTLSDYQSAKEFFSPQGQASTSLDTVKLESRASTPSNSAISTDSQVFVTACSRPCTPELDSELGSPSLTTIKTNTQEARDFGVGLSQAHTSRIDMEPSPRPNSITNTGNQNNLHTLAVSSHAITTEFQLEPFLCRGPTTAINTTVPCDMEISTNSLHTQARALDQEFDGSPIEGPVTAANMNLQESEHHKPDYSTGIASLVPNIEDQERISTRNRLINSRTKSTSSFTILSLTSHFSDTNIVSRTSSMPKDEEDMLDHDDEAKLVEIASVCPANNLLRHQSCTCGEGGHIAYREPHTYTPWATELEWRYIKEDEGIVLASLSTGIKLFPRPHDWYHQNDFILFCETPVYGFVTNDSVKGNCPKIFYDEPTNRIMITPHDTPPIDLRSQPQHPDWLPREKLCEYQAVEITGFRVWRHDRNTHTCALQTCSKILVDHDIGTQICHGCGPKSTIRYCNKDHLLADMPHHWEECGDITTLIPWYVDTDSQPPRFSRLFPAIVDVHDIRSFAKHQQRAYAIYSKGQYTVFPASSRPLSITWPTEEAAAKYAPRVERLLNAALRDQTKESVIAYLFCLLRLALRTSGAWTPRIKEALGRQFMLEFDWDVDVLDEQDACECVWAGDRADVSHCDDVCSAVCRKVGALMRGPGVQEVVERMEAEDWVLRVWARRSGVAGWRRRLAGVGYPRVKQEDLLGLRPIMGRGWQGLGAVHGLGGGWEENY